MGATLEGLAAAGVNVTVASRSRAVETLGPIGVIRVPPGDEALGRQILGVLQDALRLLVTDRSALLVLARGVARPLVPRRVRGPRSALKRFRALLSLARVRPDVVHFQWESAAVSHLPLFSIWDCPVVVSCRGSGLTVFPHTGEFEHWTRGYEQVFAQAHAIHCVSEQIRGELARFGVDPGKTHVIRPAVDTEFFAPSGRPVEARAELAVVAAGDLLWLKGFDYLLQAVARLGELGVPVRLDLFGGEPAVDGGLASDRGRLLYTIHALGLADRVTLRGRVDQIDLRDGLRRADVFVHPSLSEGIPNVVLEAMACGLPVVATDAGGTREAVTDGVEGFVVPRRDPEAIARALEGLWQDAGLRERLGSAGRARVEADFTLADQVERFVALYESLAAAP